MEREDTALKPFMGASTCRRVRGSTLNRGHRSAAKAARTTRLVSLLHEIRKDEVDRNSCKCNEC